MRHDAWRCSPPSSPSRTGIAGVLFPALLFLIGCGPSAADLQSVRFTPNSGGDWEVSTPEDQGLDPTLVAELFYEAEEMETLFGLLVVKNGYLIAEGYFNEGSIDQVSGRASATKSFTAALVGIALERGCLESVDQRMMDFFPEYAEEIQDPRKRQITIRQLLQMRAGFHDEEYTSDLFERMFFHGNWEFLSHLVDFPLASDPGAGFHYSNLTSHLLGVIVARACGQDLGEFARDFLFSPMEADLRGWQVDDDGYCWGFGEIYVSARDMARFGQLFLDGGIYDGKEIIDPGWIEESFQRYSEGIARGGWLPWYGSFRDRGYGYQWWSSRVGDHYFTYASGHGGNYIILLPELRMVLVTTADPLHELWEGGDPWKYEGAINRMVGRFIKSLPAPGSAGSGIPEVPWHHGAFLDRRRSARSDPRSGAVTYPTSRCGSNPGSTTLFGPLLRITLRIPAPAA